MRNLFSATNILRSFLTCFLVIVFTRIYLTFITVNHLIAELDSISSILLFVAYVVIWLALLFASLQISSKIIPDKMNVPFFRIFVLIVLIVLIACFVVIGFLAFVTFIEQIVSETPK